MEERRLPDGHDRGAAGLHKRAARAPIFLGSRRPAVEQRIIPTTWHEVGLGLFGESSVFHWRGYAIAGLNAAGFSAEGIKEARQQGSQSLANDIGLVGRLDLVRIPGLLLGASVFTGNSGQGAASDGRKIRARVTLFDAHAQYEYRGLQARVLYVRSSIADVPLINAANGFRGAESVGSRQYGVYVEAGYDLLLRRKGAGPWAVIPFFRHERLNPQDRVPVGFEKDPRLDQKIWTAGVSVKPLTGVAFKADYQWLANKARTGTNQLNLAMGFLF